MLFLVPAHHYCDADAVEAKSLKANCLQGYMGKPVIPKDLITHCVSNT